MDFITKKIYRRFIVNIKTNYQYKKLFSGVAVISVILFLGGCNELLQDDDGITEQPAVNSESLSTSESCKKTRGFVVKGHENEEENCQQP